jgi:hypothetical protein
MHFCIFKIGGGRRRPDKEKLRKTKKKQRKSKDKVKTK